MMVSKLTRLVAVTFKYNFHTYYFFAKVVKIKICLFGTEAVEQQKSYGKGGYLNEIW